MDFTGKVALITGAASGMGLLFAENIASLGGNAVMCDVNEEVLKEKVKQGVDVRIIYDDMGCIITLPNRYYKNLKEIKKQLKYEKRFN